MPATSRWPQQVSQAAIPTIKRGHLGGEPMTVKAIAGAIMAEQGLDKANL